jgi:hypothetical protein
MNRKQRSYQTRVQNAIKHERFENDNTHTEIIFHNDIPASKSNLESKIYHREGRMESTIHVSNPKSPSGEAYHSAFHEIGHVRAHADRLKGRLPPRKDAPIRQYGLQSPVERLVEERLANKYARKNIDKLPQPLKVQALWSQRAAMDTHMYHDKPDHVIKLFWDNGYIFHKTKRRNGEPR